VPNWSINLTLRSECSMELVTDQGVEITIRRVIDWNTCIVQTWDGLAQPIGSFDFRIGRSRCSRLLRVIIFSLIWTMESSKLVFYQE